MLAPAHKEPSKEKVKVAQSCPTLWDPMDCSLPGFSVHEILRARILGWVAMPFSRGSAQPRDWTQVSCIMGGLFTVWATREGPLGLGNEEPLRVFHQGSNRVSAVIWEDWLHRCPVLLPTCRRLLPPTHWKATLPKTSFHWQIFWCSHRQYDHWLVALKLFGLGVWTGISPNLNVDFIYWKFILSAFKFQCCESNPWYWPPHQATAWPEG